MQPIAASEQASALRRVHGNEAEVLVGTKIRQCEASGETDKAESWKMIQQVLRQRSGASES
ncbi:hypothetical protein [Pseudooceanicola atlanticus]|jgi:hypothetical protein|uniref:Uncharacterized protein n=1 Tax=Pseudooceanicola atlanticus TaxID=1461694 RepID=A0A0A0EEW2_9RHOB|nr:hypothetical protein [Pseudooceanicola atlanticus]KGM48924.1 hypothetical protein ATO9_09490 [Pseudooceanicola atlanticus]